MSGESIRAKMGGGGVLLLALFLIGSAILTLVGVFSADHAISFGDLLALVELLAGIFLLVGK